MSLRFCSHTSGTRTDVVFDVFTESGPSVVVPDKVYGLTSTWMSGKDMVMLVAENTEL